MNNEIAVRGFIAVFVMFCLVLPFCFFSNEGILLYNFPEVTHVKSYDNDIMLMTNAINTYVLDFSDGINMCISKE